MRSTDYANPRVGLLNIGSEDIKGNDQVKQAAQLLESADLNYVGYVEGDGIYQDVADVVVCDGFAGNVALKSSEGVAKLVSTFMREEFSRNWLTKAAGLAALPVLKALRARLDPRRYNGGSFSGTSGHCGEKPRRGRRLLVLQRRQRSRQSGRGKRPQQN